MKDFTRVGAVAGVAMLVAVFALGCPSKGDDAASKIGEKGVGQSDVERPPPATLDDFESIVVENAAEMLVFLSDGNPPSDAASQGVARPQTKALSQAETQKLLARLSPIQREDDDEKDFAKREDSKPPPRTGDTVKTSFPPPVDKERPDAVAVDQTKKLEVLRYQPEGDLPIAAKISVTFNQPMVAITSHDDTIAKGVPVEIDPTPEGSWRWIGSKTLLFEPVGARMPMATHYTVSVKAGVKSATGTQLVEDKTFKFSTPPVTMKNYYPSSGTYGLDQAMFISFDQDIDKAAVLSNIVIESGDKKFSPIEADAASIETDKRLQGLVDNAMEGRFLVIKAPEKLPYDSTITVRVKKGTPSKEGPRTTESDMSFSFRTYGPLKVINHRCGYRCNPQSSFSFRFSNRLDESKFEESWVTSEPEFPTRAVSTSGDWIYVNGWKQGRKTYRITIAKGVTDEFGQTMEEDQSFEFEVGPADPNLYATSGEFVVLDPSGDPGFTVFSTNYESIRVKAWQVEPKDWNQYLRWKRDWRYYGKQEIKPPGKVVWDKIVATEGKPDDLAQVKIALNEALGGDGFGNLLLEITPNKTMPTVAMPEYKPTIRTWVQATQIGLDGFIDPTEFIGWATSLKSGEPLQGVTLTLGTSGASAVTDKTGIAKINLPNYVSEKHGKEGDFLLAKKGDDVAFLPESTYNPNSSPWYRQERGDNASWFIFDDRKMYKPNEEVSVKGWIRKVDQRENGDVSLVTGKTKITYKVMGPRGNEITKGETDSTGLGGFDFKFKLPATPNLGQARIELRTTGGDVYGYATHYFDIQEFRTPEFEVSASVNEGPHFAGGEAIATVEAKYYAGGALPNADTNWSVNTQESSFTPPNQQKYSFGMWTPWWQRSTSNRSGNYESFQAKTDASGAHNLQLKFSEIDPPKPMSVIMNASVMDVNRQQWTAKTTVLVHPSQYYVGMRTERYFVEKGKPLKVDLIASDIDGNLTPDRPVKVVASRVKWIWRNGEYRQDLVDKQTCDFMSKAEAHTCEFKTDVGGQYKIAATTVDDYGRLNYTEITRWVSGGKRPVSRKIEMEQATLIPDSETYQPGDTAEILVQSPFVPAEGLLTVRRSGIVEERRFTMSEPTMVLNVPIKRTHIPNVHVEVDLVGNAKRLNAKGEEDDSLPRRPAIASGTLDLKVPPTERTLLVETTPAKDKVNPGESTSVKVSVKDADGKPLAGAEVAIVVVDEAILALSAYQMADPISVFYTHRGTNASERHLRPFVELVDPSALVAAQQPPGREAERSKGGKRRMKKKSMMMDAAPAPAKSEAAPMEMEEAADEAFGMGGLAMDGEIGGGGGDANTPIAVRSNFNPLAAFAPAVKTNGSGRATIQVKMPDNLTRYRIMAVAVSGENKFGTGESAITARLPLMVRPSAPRFLNFGDKFELPVVLQNQTDAKMTVNLAPRAANLELASANGVSVEVPPNDRVEVRFPANTAKAGTARFQVGVAAGSFADAAEVSLPVWTPATSEAFATYGVVDKGAIVQPVKMPGEVWPQFGGLEVQTSSTAMQSLTDAFIYLYHYDYECAEQISSRVISVAALRDVLSAFDAEGMPSDTAIKASMKKDIKELVGRQNYDGGFGLWRKGQPSWPYVSLHVAHALVRAKDKGYEVPDYAMNRANNYLKNIENYIPSYYSEWTRRHIIAYSLYVRGLMKDYDPAKAKALIQRAGKLENLTFEATGWLLGVFANSKDAKYAADRQDIRKFLNNRVTETAGNAHFAATMSDGHHLIMHSNRRADGIILEALMDDQPKLDLIPKIVSGLMAHRTKGRWGNTQENAFVLLALDKYFNVYENITPDFVARIWLGERYAGEHKFKGRTTERHAVDVPMRYLKKDAQNLYLQKDGKGRMYYRIGMTYAPKSLFLEPADHGFVVERKYSGADNPEDVKRRSDGAWEIKAGAKVKVELTMVAETRRYHVALVDPLPAGLESMNPALAVTGDLPQDKAMDTGRSSNYSWWWWSRPWYEHQNMRDERTEAFTTLLWGGVHSYTYYARATTPGEFVVPPAKAEEMYHPETFGRSASDRVYVID